MKKDLLTIFRHNVQLLAKAQRLNSMSLGRMAGLDQKTAYRVLTFNDVIKTTTLATVEAVAKALGVEPYQLLIDTNDDGDKFGLNRRITELVMKLSPAARAQVLQLAELLAQANK